MTLDEFLSANEGLFSSKTPYERKYVEKVLAYAKGIDWSTVSAQTTFVDSTGVNRRIDFTIIEGDAVRIAIEVDGYDKTGTGSGMTHDEFADWSLREMEIAAQGYRVVRVANRLVDREPDRCTRCVELVLKRERALAEKLDQMAPESRPSLEDARVRYDDELLTPGERDEIASSQSRAIEQLRDELGKSLDREEHLKQGAAAGAGSGSGRRPFWVYVAAVCAFALSAGVVIGVVSCGVGDSTSSNGSNSSSLCQNAKPWASAAGQVGERVTITGPVEGTKFLSRSKGKPTYLNVGNAYPSNDRLVVLIWGSNRDAFPSAPEDAYDGVTVAVRGTVKVYEGLPEIAIASPEQIAICD